MPYDIRKNEAGEYCMYKKVDGKLVPGSCHADKGETMRMMQAMMANEKMGSDTIHTIDDFVSVTAGNPFRVFPFGVIYKNGVKREITPEFAKQIKLPHFKAPIKLASHDDSAPAGGFITALEVRADGLYVVPEWNEAGLKAMQDGAYRYNSPEILWSGGLEDPNTGDVISAPMLLGTALLHMPHLGEATALYSIEPITEDQTMNEDMNIPAPFKGLWDKFIASLTPAKVEPEKVEVIPDEYKAAVVERDELKARIEAQAKADERKGRVEKFDAELKETKADPTMAELLADVDPATAEAIMKQFKALSAQISEPALTGETGTEGAQSGGDPKAEFNAAVLALAADKKILYTAAFEEAKIKHADLFAAAFKK